MIRDIMKTEVATVQQEDTLDQVARLLLGKTISGAPVVDSEGKLIGVVSEKDIFHAVFPSYQEFYVRPDIWVNYDWTDVQDRLKKITVGEIMTRRVFTVEGDEPILKVGAMMLAHHIHRVPVLHAGKLVGIVTRKDIYRSLLRKALGS